MRDFLARNSVPYRWYLADDPEAGRLLSAAGLGDDKLPVVVTADGTALVEPSDAELAQQVGLATDPSTDFYDLVVVGGGPAGLGAAVYGGSEGLRTVLVERRATGGQAGTSSRIENYLGFPDGVSGEQLTERARRQALKFEVEMLTTRDVVALEQRGRAPGWCGSRTAPSWPRTRSSWPPACRTGCWTRPGWRTWPAAASTTAPPPPRAPAAAARTSTSSAGRTPPARPPCTSPGTRTRSPC